MDLILRKAVALTDGACWIGLSYLKRLLSPAVLLLLCRVSGRRTGGSVRKMQRLELLEC